MIDNKKEQERAELHRTIWGIANDLRGSVDGWDFKNYVLVMLFYRYISENLTNYINAGEAEAGTPDFDYTQLSDEEAEAAREDMVTTKGFFILPSELFCNVLAKADTDENLNERTTACPDNIHTVYVLLRSPQASPRKYHCRACRSGRGLILCVLVLLLAERESLYLKYRFSLNSFDLRHYHTLIIACFYSEHRTKT